MFGSLAVKNLRDGKLVLFGVLNLVQGLLVAAVPALVPSLEPAVNGILVTAAVVMWLAAPALVLGGRLGRWVAAISCLLHWLLGLGFAALVVASASYLYGIYGQLGHAIGAIGFVIALLVLVVFWLIPGHELHFLRQQGLGTDARGEP
jgi:hypothetical protein